MSRSLSDTIADGSLQCPISGPSSFNPEEYRHIEGAVSGETFFFGHYCRINNSARRAEEILKAVIDD